MFCDYFWAVQIISIDWLDSWRSVRSKTRYPVKVFDNSYWYVCLIMYSRGHTQFQKGAQLLYPKNVVAENVVPLEIGLRVTLYTSLSLNLCLKVPESPRYASSSYLFPQKARHARFHKCFSKVCSRGFKGMLKGFVNTISFLCWVC